MNTQPMRGAVYWFIFTGLLVLVLGALVDWLEAHGPGLPRFLGWSLLALTGAGVAIMPASGVWLLLIPAIGALRGPARARVAQP